MADRALMLHPMSCWLWLALLLPAPLWAGSFNRLPSPPKAEAAPAEAAPPAAPASAAEGHEGAASEPVKEPGNGSVAAEQTASEPESDGLADPVGEPTYGEACIYGPRGVVHAPAGRDCEAERARKEAAAEALASSGSGRCIFGRGGEVVYAPPGERCEGRVRNVAPRPTDRPRRRRSLIYD